MGLDIFRSLLRRGSFVLKPSVYSLCFPVQARGIKIFMDKKKESEYLHAKTFSQLCSLIQRRMFNFVEEVI